MAEHLHSKIIDRLKSQDYQPLQPKGLARELELKGDEEYHAFRDALRELMHEGRVVLGDRGAVVLPAEHQRKDEFVGTYRHNRRGFGFVVPSDPTSHEDLYIPEGQNGGAITGDVVRARIVSRGQRDGKAFHSGRISEVLQRTQRRFVGSLVKQGTEWMMLPDGNTITEPVLTPDASSRHVKPGTKVVVELTTYPERGQRAQGVITEILGEAGEKDVDLKSVIVQFNLPGEFPDEVKTEARLALDTFDADAERDRRIDLSDQIVCTIDPDDAKDYDDAISLRKLDNGNWELGVHIADVSYFVKPGSALDTEAHQRGNSSYFPGYVIPMLPEVLSNGVCSLQEAVPRLCKSAFITYDEDAQPISAKFVNTIINSAKRLRYTEAQAIIDNAQTIPHPEGPRRLADYPEPVIDLLHQMNELARRLQKRRLAAGQLVLDLPEVDLVLDESGKVAGTKAEDTSFTHTIIEMFMVEANEAVARLLNSLNVPFLRRIHPEPDLHDAERLRHFVEVSGYRLPKQLDRKALQALLTNVRGRPEAFAINLAILKSLSRAEYSPQIFGHFALASEHYCHFTSPIRRYADLTIHRLLDAYFEARELAQNAHGKAKRKLQLDGIPSEEDLVELGRHISFTERRSEDAERELRQVKLLELMTQHVGEEFEGVVTGITNFGIFVQIRAYLIDGLIRYEDLMDDWWDVDERTGVVRGQRTGKKIGIGDVTKVVVVRVDPPRRELTLAISDLGATNRPAQPPQKPHKGKKKESAKRPPAAKPGFRGGKRPPGKRNKGPHRRRR